MDNKKKYSTVGMGAVIAVILFIWLFLGLDQDTSLLNPPNLPPFLIGGLSSEQAKDVSEFKIKIFKRLKSDVPFSQEEKDNLRLILKEQGVSFQFSSDEVKEIEEVIK